MPALLMATSTSFLCIAQGGPGSVFPGVYKSMWDEIDKYNIEKFGCTQEELDANRLPINIMF